MLARVGTKPNETPSSASQMNIPPNNAEVASRFGSVAQRFCSVVDSAPNLDRIELLVQVYRILPQLISEAISLPSVELSDSENEEEEREKSVLRARARLSDAQWGHLYARLKEKLADWDLYWQVWDPTKDNEAIHGTLADDIADIYRDVKEGLVLNEAQQALPEDNIWEWRLGFYSHWGKHAIDALRTIHFLLEETLS
jgi:hypothetical protein